MDIIYLSGLQVEAVIGISEWERHVKQTIILDIEMAADVRHAATTDCIENTLNYKTVSKRLSEFISHSEYHLVETLAEQVATILLQEFAVPWVRIRLNKIGALSGARDVGVIIERGGRT